MTLRAGLFAWTTLLGMALLVPNQAGASTLLGAGKTVQAFYYNGVFASPEGEDNVATNTSDPASLLNPVDYQEGAADLSTIVVGDTQIVITNLSPGAPFCFENDPGTSCPDVIDGFDFLFTGENIFSVSVDGNSASDFLPVSGTFQSNTHLGLQLISANEIRVDVTGDAPVNGHELIIDVQNPPTTPEPSSMLPFTILGLGFLIRKGALKRRAE